MPTEQQSLVELIRGLCPQGVASVVVSVTDGRGLRIEVAALPVACPAPPAARGKWLSPTALAVINVLADSGEEWLSTATIAARMGREPTANFRGMISELVEREIVQACQRRGIRLLVPPGQFAREAPAAPPPPPRLAAL